MYIEPNTTIKILHDIPIDNSYNDTIFHLNSAEQQTYFNKFVKYTLQKQSYQRVGKGKCRVNYKYEDLYDCNYMMFRNDSFSTKWFYAFITNIDYINPTVSEITYEIDVIQTWFFEFALGVRPCFVEREHSETDNIGDNIVPEPMDTGDIICYSMGSTSYFDSYVAVLAVAFDPTDIENGNSGGYYGGMPSGLSYASYRIDDDEQMDRFISLLGNIVTANLVDSVVSIWVMPSQFFTSNDTPIVLPQKVAMNTKLDGYEPKNNKLLTYPYNFLGVDCGNNSAIYRYEYFDTDDGTCQFIMTSCIAPNTEIALVPMDYNNGSGLNYVEKLVMTGFPQIGYAIDSYRAYVASGGLRSDQIALGSSIGSVMLGTATSNPYAVGMGAVGLASGMNNIMIEMNRPPQARGSQGGGVDISTRSKNFWFKFMGVNNQTAKIIDDYFTMYGYATNRVKVPNIFGGFYHGLKSRPYWNYLKTKDFNFFGSVPSDDKVKICNIMNKGVTFWKEPLSSDILTYVGNYNLDNSPQ